VLEYAAEKLVRFATGKTGPGDDKNATKVGCQDATGG